VKANQVREPLECNAQLPLLYLLLYLREDLRIEVSDIQKVQGDYLWRKQSKINAHTRDAHVSCPKGNNTAARPARTLVTQAVAVVVAAVRIRNVQAPSPLK
jgi:hypothetical protein